MQIKDIVFFENKVTQLRYLPDSIIIFMGEDDNSIWLRTDTLEDFYKVLKLIPETIEDIDLTEIAENKSEISVCYTIRDNDYSRAENIKDDTYRMAITVCVEIDNEYYSTLIKKGIEKELDKIK